MCDGGSRTGGAVVGPGMKCVSYTNRLAGDLKTHNFGGVSTMRNVYFGDCQLRAAHPSRRHQTMGLVAAKGYTGSSQDFQFSPPVFTSATTGCVRAACQECLNHEVLSSPDCELSSPDCELAMALMQSPSCQQQQQLREWVPSPHGRSRI